jgi:hypothetical protein
MNSSDYHDELELHTEAMNSLRYECIVKNYEFSHCI